MHIVHFISRFDCTCTSIPCIHELIIGIITVKLKNSVLFWVTPILVLLIGSRLKCRGLAS